VHAVLVGEVLAEPDAEEDVVRLVVVRPEEVRVVRRDDRQPQLPAQREDGVVMPRLALGVVRLHLEVVAIPEDVGVPRGRFARAGFVARLELLRDLAGEAGRADDEPLAVLRQQLAVDARLGVEALRVGEGGELHEVLVAHHVPREEHEMVADDRLELLLLRLLLELPCGVEIPVIGDRQRRLLQLERPGDQVIDAVGAIEEGVFRVAVEMDEGHLRKNSDPDPSRQRLTDDE